MRLALLSDIHANLEALEAVFRDVLTQQVDQIVCLGDVVGYGADPVPCLDLVDKCCRAVLLGNHEAAVMGRLSEETLNEYAAASTQWTRKQLGDHHLAMMAQWPLEHRIENTHLVHSSPFEPHEWHYILTPKAAERSFAATSAFITFFGHSHLPSIFTLGTDGQVKSRFGHEFQPLEENRYLVNVGSVGQPRDDDPRSCYVIYDTSTIDVLYRRVVYDYSITQRKMAAVNAPSQLIDRIAIGR